MGGCIAWIKGADTKWASDEGGIYREEWSRSRQTGRKQGTKAILEEIERMRNRKKRSRPSLISLDASQKCVLSYREKYMPLIFLF